MLKTVFITIGMVALWGSQALGQTPQHNMGQRLSKPIKIERQSPVTDVPLTLRSGKIYLQARVNYVAGEFIFDTGSPTIFSRQFAEQFEFDVIGQNTGRDANGVPIQMDIAIMKSIVIGDVKFQDVPVMIHDFADVPLTKCFMPNGILGSELLPGSAWRIDLPAAKLSIASRSDELPKLADTKSAPLNFYGYPFAPIVDYSIGKLSDKALFDTGNSSEVALFKEVMADKAVRKKIDKKTLQVGEGRHGVSAGGVGEILPLQQFELKTFQLGEYDAGRVRVHSRPIPPTLIGAGLLKSHIVTLDYPESRFLIAEHETPLPRKESTGFALMLLDDTVEVAQIFDTSKAHQAGLKLGDDILAINGKPLEVTTDTQKCETSLWLANEFDAARVKTLKVKRDQEVMEVSF